MNTKSLILVAIIFYIYQTSLCQNIDDGKFQGLRNKTRVHYYDHNNKIIGCGFSLECRGFDLIFYEIVFSQKDSWLRLKGRAYHGISISGNDTLPLFPLEIVFAKPKKKYLTKMNKIGSVNKKQTESFYPKRLGDFDIKAKLKKGYRLYFINPSLFVIEYDVSKLLEKNWLN